MNYSNRAKLLPGESLLKMGRSLKILAIAVIVILSLGMAMLVYGQLRQGSALGEVIQNPTQWLSGFTVMMLLTVGYLVGKGWETSRRQSRLIEQLLQQEVELRAQKLDPITQFHHPAVCRDILLRHGWYAGRLESPLAILQLTVPNLGNLSLDPLTQPVTQALIRRVRELCRPIDSLLRWTPNSFLLVLPEVGEETFTAVHHRFSADLDQWCEENMEAVIRPALEWRAVICDTLSSSEDVLVSVQRSLDTKDRLMPAAQNETPQPWQQEKTVAIAMKLQIHGTDGSGRAFQEAIVTRRVARDRFWFALNKDLADQSPLTVTAHNGSFQEIATVIRRIKKDGEQLVEAQFDKTPARWVVGGA